MNISDNRFRQFELPRLLLEIGQALDKLPARDERSAPNLIDLRIELDQATAGAVRCDLKRIKARLHEAALTHLQYRHRDGDRIALELLDAGTDMPALFAVSASIVDHASDDAHANGDTSTETRADDSEFGGSGVARSS